MDSDADDCSQGCSRILKNFVGILLVVFVWLLFLVILASGSSDEFATITSPKNVKCVVPVPMTKNYAPANADPVYASKRRVPSGPDPIHNRHVGETRRPPGRV